ncbi:MAG: trehalose-phosphatase [Acidobacteria bacterium]|nr:trehalose-phosphatase [Acidobacteriota bacterium]
MNEPADSTDILADFFRLSRQKNRFVLMLDYDGTLSPFTPDRDNAKPYPEIMNLVNDINKKENHRVVIISGRSISLLKKLIGSEYKLELWGSHGYERINRNGKSSIAEIDENSRKNLEEIKHLLENKEEFKGLTETKPVGVVLHWRGQGREIQKKIGTFIEKKIRKLTENTELLIHNIDNGIEIKHGRLNKGDAVKSIISEENVEDTSFVYLGDDLTDEDAFEAVNVVGLSVLVRNEFRPTIAQTWIKPPEELFHFLRKWSLQ